MDLQEPEIEYVEDYEDLEEEDDMEDFGGLEINEHRMGDDSGKTYNRCFLCQYIILPFNMLVICPYISC